MGRSIDAPEQPDPTDDRSRLLLQQYLDGDVEAFGTLAREHYQRLWPVALRMCSGDPEDAAEALQEGMIAAMRGASGYRGEARVSTWLHRIVVNACLDQHRRRRRRPVQQAPLDDAEVLEPRDRISERETSLEIERALAQLPAEQRAAIILVDIEGWPVADAAAILGVRPGTVKSRCSRGRARLADSLSHLRNRAEAEGIQRAEWG